MLIFFIFDYNQETATVVAQWLHWFDRHHAKLSSVITRNRKQCKKLSSKSRAHSQHQP